MMHGRKNIKSDSVFLSMLQVMKSDIQCVVYAL